MIRLKQIVNEILKESLENSLDTFTSFYIDVALATSDSSYHYNHGPEKSQWDSEYDPEEPHGEEEHQGEPLSKNYTIEDIAPETLREIIKDCKDFQQKYSEWYSAAGWDDGTAGYDFWLTRNGHGAGFWDRNSSTLHSTVLFQQKGKKGIEEVREILTKAAKEYGPYSLYLGDGAYDGLIFGFKG
jgi:hypothetical protein